MRLRALVNENPKKKRHFPGILIALKVVRIYFGGVKQFPTWLVKCTKSEQRN